MRLIAALYIAAAAFAQSPLQFEVASIKESASSGGVRGGCHGIDSVYTALQQAEAPPLGWCVFGDARLSHLIGTAYNVPLINLKTGPDWIQRGDLRFQVQAKAGDPTKHTEQQLLTMLQNLLVERFQLKFHKETSETTGFALTVAKDGPMLQISSGEQTLVGFAGPNGDIIPKPIPGQPFTMKARKMPLAMLTNVLSVLGYGQGIDRTGLTGSYDFTLTWDDNAGPALATALREQLGLVIERTKIPVSTFVVDSAEKPSAN